MRLDDVVVDDAREVADFDNLRLVTESVVGEQGADSAMLASLVEHLVSAAEVWQVTFDAQRQADGADGMHGQAA